MPPVYKFICDKVGMRDENGKPISGGCKFQIRSYSGPYMYLLKDGNEYVLPHPLEDDTARSLTGKALDDLVKEKAIVFKHARMCLNCLKFEDDCTCSKKKLTEIPKLEGMECPGCKKGKIIKIANGIS
jgi:hypothetical protein